MSVWTQPIDSAGTWLCEHADSEGNPSPATRLTVADAIPEVTVGRSSGRRAYLYCPDCGAYWRAWQDLGVAKSYRQWPCPVLPKYRHFPWLDIDAIIEALRETFPDLAISQHQQTWPGDDDGIWWFHLGGKVSDLQIESGYGMCPFIVETDELCCENARTVATVEEAVALITEHLRTEYLRTSFMAK